MELIVLKHERRLSQIEALNDMPLYPTEQVLWDETIVPHETYSDGCLALPKLNVQFLTMHDYLLRNLNLFRLESTYDIRTDMEDVIPRMKAFQNASGETQFAGYVPRAVLPAVQCPLMVYSTFMCAKVFYFATVDLTFVCVFLIDHFTSFLFFSLVFKVVSHGAADCWLLNRGDGSSQHW